MKNKLLILLLLSSSILKAQFKANAGADQFVCIFDTLKVVGSGLNTGDTGTYQWRDIQSNLVLSNSSKLVLKVIGNQTKSYELAVTKKTYKGTFVSMDTMVLTVNARPTFTYSGLGTRCFDQGCWNLTSGNVALAQPGNKTGVHYFQKYKSPSWISGSSPYIYCPKISNSQISQTGFRDTICYDYTDSNGCYNYECKSLRILANPVVNLNSAKVCQANGAFELSKLISEPITSNRPSGIESFRVLTAPSGSGVNINTLITIDTKVNPYLYYLDIGNINEPKKCGDYQIEYCFKAALTGCQRCDTTNVEVLKLPIIEFDTIPPFCLNSAQVNLDSFVRDSSTGKRLSYGQWQCVEYGGSRNIQNSKVRNAINNSVWLNQYFLPSTDAGQFLLKYVNYSSGCAVSDSTMVVVNGLPQIKINSLDTICNNSGMVQLSSNYASNDTNGIWIGKYVQGNYLKTDSINLGNSNSINQKYYFIYRSPLTNCANIDSISTTIIKKPQFKFNYSLQANSKYLVDFNLIDSNMNLGSFNWLWYFGNGDTSTQKYPTGIIFNDSGEYKAFLSIDNGICATSDSITFKLNKVISHINSIQHLVKLYPNPTNGILNLRIPIDGELKLYNPSGLLLLSQIVNANQLNSINISHLSEGIYFISIENNGYQYWNKVIKN